jgi:isoquinoline 1-oxidoreductase/isoquinoline 1-oxidoreductase beta subunit
VAQAAEVSVENNKIRVHRVLCSIDCGLVVNPDIVRGQVEGAIMYGLTAALYGNIEFENGAVKESNFHDYKVLRINEAPLVKVVIVESEEAPTGVGEPGLPPIAPAVANAVYGATGVRLSSMPLSLA